MKEHNTQAQIVILPYVSAVDPRTKERSQPATTDSVEGADNA
ncbi:hypothetical protein ACFX6L_004699 [Salmonella enterica]